MTDSFRWHPKARLVDSSGAVVPALPQGGVVLPDTPSGLAAAIGQPAFRIGAGDQPGPDPQDTPVFETLTSGSTGRPKRIRRTQASWTASFAVNAGFGIGPGARVAVLGRLVHSLSLYGAVEGLHLGAEVHLLDALRPDRQAAALGRRGVTHLCATPAQVRLLAAAEVPWPQLQFVFVGGSKLDAALRDALAAMAPNAQVREFYGAAETSFITLADADTPDGSVGQAYPGVEIALDPGGEVWVRSPYLFLGYGDLLADEGQGGGLGSTRWRDGWLSVGEIGSLQSGYLYLKGRAGRMVTVADQNVFPEEIEGLLAAMPGIDQAVVVPVADPKRGMVLVACVQGDRSVEGATLAALRARLGPLKAPKRLIWLTDWPTLQSGKTDLSALEGWATWRG